MAALPPGWATLSNDEKMAMLELMAADIKFDDNHPITEELRLELRSRLAAHEQNPERAIPWEVVKAELLKESIAEEEADTDDSELNEEFERRIAYDRANSDSGRPWAEVKADILKRLR